MRLFDSRNGESLRAHLGAGLERSGSADFAIRQIRLARVDFMPSELRALKRCRVLLGRLDAETLAPPDAPPASLRTAALLDLASSGRLEVRSSGLLSWDPDFALLGPEPGTPDTLLFGAIQFASQRPSEGVALACVTRDELAVHTAATRFEELWERAHDTLEAVLDALCRARTVAES